MHTGGGLTVTQPYTYIHTGIHAYTDRTNMPDMHTIIQTIHTYIQAHTYCYIHTHIHTHAPA